MTVRREADGTIVLEGRCPIEDAEPLWHLLQATPHALCDWTRCNHLHTAVVQIIWASRPTLAGPCGDTWIQTWVAPQLR